MKDITLYPTPHEQRLLQQKADEYGMSINDFVAYLIRKAIEESNAKIKTIVKH